MFVTSLFKHRHCYFEKFCVCIWVLTKFATSVAQKKFRILFVRQAVSGNMFWLKRNCCLQARAPLINGLTGQTKHQIDVDVCETCVAQNPKRFFCLLRVVLASEQSQQFVVPRLHAEADPVDSECFRRAAFRAETLPGFASIVHSTN